MTLEEIRALVDSHRDEADFDIEDWRRIVEAFDTLLEMVNEHAEGH